MASPSKPRPRKPRKHARPATPGRPVRASSCARPRRAVRPRARPNFRTTAVALPPPPAQADLREFLLYYSLPRPGRSPQRLVYAVAVAAGNALQRASRESPVGCAAGARVVAAVRDWARGRASPAEVRQAGRAAHRLLGSFSRRRTAQSGCLLPVARLARGLTGAVEQGAGIDVGGSVLRNTLVEAARLYEIAGLTPARARAVLLEDLRRVMEAP